VAGDSSEPGMSAKVIGRAAQPRWVVRHQADAAIAMAAQQPAHPASVVAVVNIEGVAASRRRALADRADTSLRGEQLIVFGQRHSIASKLCAAVARALTLTMFRASAPVPPLLICIGGALAWRAVGSRVSILTHAENLARQVLLAARTALCVAGANAARTEASGDTSIVYGSTSAVSHNRNGSAWLVTSVSTA